MDALISVKYFCENALEYFVASAVSLLSSKTKRSKEFPVGKVKFLSLYSLSFFEFLEAIGGIKLVEYLKSIKAIESIAQALHERALEHFKMYMFIGGMPEAVKKYVDSKNLLEVRSIQQAIIKTYEFDFAKHSPVELISRITAMWHSLPRNLAKENKKFIFGAIRQCASAREYDAATLETNPNLPMLVCASLAELAEGRATQCLEKNFKK